MPAQFLRRWTWQMALNLMLVAGVFIGASYFAGNPPAWREAIPFGMAGWRSLLWVAAVLVSMPLLIATYRKLGAVGLLLGELAAARIKREPTAAAVQAVLGNTIPLAGAIGMGLLVLVLSAALLPSWKILVVLALVVSVVTALTWQSLIRVYSIGQVALEETFSHPPPAEQEPEALPAPLAGLLREARIEAITLGKDTSAGGKMIRELALRTQTGASIVAIERHGKNVVNPGPDEELLAGDHVLLLGTERQLEAARAQLLGANGVH